MLMTTMDAETMPKMQVLDLYRLRWQIEIAFENAKSLAALDNIQTKEERLTKTAVWTKLILAIIFPLGTNRRSGAFSKPGSGTSKS